MNEHPPLLILMSVIGIYVFYLWWQDYTVAKHSAPSSNALPGARPTSSKANVIAAVGAVLIVIGETLGELQLGLTDEQSKMTALFGLYTLVAAFIEELIFRGFLVIEGKGNVLKWTGVIGASLLFSILHPFLWKWDMMNSPEWHLLYFWKWPDWFTWQITSKGVFSSGAVFVSSLWFYIVRFAAFNPTQSLLPCIIAHGTKNLCVIAVKGAQGYISGWW